MGRDVTQLFEDMQVTLSLNEEKIKFLENASLEELAGENRSLRSELSSCRRARTILEKKVSALNEELASLQDSEPEIQPGEQAGTGEPEAGDGLEPDGVVVNI